MARNNKVEIDEDAIRRMMTGERLDRRQESSTNVLSERKTETADMPSEDSSGGNDSGYRSLFLVRRASVPRRQTYISLQLYDKLTDILSVIAKDLSVPMFLDNLISYHLERHGEEINVIYEKRFKKPL